jgi:hypothetical protein
MLSDSSSKNTHTKNIIMRIDALTDSPQKLVDAINKAIKDGDLKTWKRVENNKQETLYSHTPEQWAEKAMLKPKVHSDKATFLIAWWSKNDEPTLEVKGYVLGRFTEVLMVHFTSYFTKLETSS